MHRYDTNESNCAKPRPPWMILDISQTLFSAQRTIHKTKLSILESKTIMHEGKLDFLMGQQTFLGILRDTMVTAVYNLIRG